MAATQTQAEPALPVKKSLLARIGLPAALLCLGGGGAYAAMTTGLVGSVPASEDAGPLLVRKGADDPYHIPVDGEEALAPVYGEGGSKYRTVYFQFKDEFTSNLRGSDALMQVALAVSTQRDGRVLIWLREHELAIRSQVLSTIADTSEEEVRTPQGKERLQQRLAASINRILTEHEGFGGVDRVYFRSIIVQ